MNHFRARGRRRRLAASVAPSLHVRGAPRRQRTAMTYLLVANDGGHVVELRALAERFDNGHDRAWVDCADTPDPGAARRRDGVLGRQGTDSRLEGGRSPTRCMLRRILNSQTFSVGREHGFEPRAVVTSAGRAPANPAHYIESVTRTDTLSMSGKDPPGGARGHDVRPVAAVADRRDGTTAGSVLDGYRVARDSRRDRSSGSSSASGPAPATDSPGSSGGS